MPEKLKEGIEMIKKNDDKLLRCAYCGNKRFRGKYMRGGHLEYHFVCSECIKEERINELNDKFDNMTYLEVKHLVNGEDYQKLLEIDKNLSYKEAKSYIHTKGD